MHVKTNIEHTIIQIIIVAICPLLLAIGGVRDAIFFAISTSICFLLSAFICNIFNKVLSRNLKIFVTALLATFIITLINEYLKSNPFWGFEATNNFFFTVLSTMCLCVDTYYIETKAVVKNYLLRVIMNCLLFIFIVVIYSLIYEMIAFGTVFGFKMGSYVGTEFFRSITFRLVWLGILGFLADTIYRAYIKYMDRRKLTYQKFVKRIRDEKEFQYDELRRKKLLTSPIEIKHITNERADEIKQQISENVAIEIEEEKPEEEPEEEKTDKKTKSKKHHKLGKFARGSKVEKISDTRKTGGDE